MTSGKKRVLASPEALSAALDEALEAADKIGVRLAVCGGYAMQFYGSDRLTADVDVVADAPLSSMPKLQRVSFGGEVVSARNGVHVDVILRSDDYQDLYEAALNCADETEEGIPIVRPGYLLAMKMVAGRKKDWADIETLILNGYVGEDAVRVVKEFLGRYAAKDLRNMLEEVRLMGRLVR